MIQLLAYNYPRLGRGAHQFGQRFAKLYPQYKYVELNNLNIINYEEQMPHVFLVQNNNYYNHLLPKLNFRKDIFYINPKNSYKDIMRHKLSNGFSIAKSNNIPYLPNIIETPAVSCVPDNVCVGYYHRLNVYQDKFSYLAYLKELYLSGINILLLGEAFENLPSTTDKKFFLDNITHYLYPKSINSDAFPMSLFEAIVTNKQIIIPDLTRSFQDGVDDLSQCIRFHKELDLDKYLDNSDSILNFIDLKKLNLFIADSQFKQPFDAARYKSFKDFIKKEFI